MDCFLYRHIGKESEREKCKLSRWGSLSRNYEKKTWIRTIISFGGFFNPFVPNIPLLYPLKTLENRKVF